MRPIFNEPGQVIAGRYELVEMLGEGGMAEVWRAVQLNLGREVALKLLHAHIATDPTARARFEREARVAATLRHPNAVDVYDVGEDEDHAFLAMELLEGRALRDEVDAHLPPLAPQRTVQVAARVADVLATAHDRGLVHRDLKPENIFLERAPGGEERVVVVDFGLAFIVDDDLRGRLTREGRAIGTPDYMSPEQCSGGTLGPPSDVYSLGCVLYEMLTTRPPFAGRDESPAYLHLLAPVIPPREARPDLPIPAALSDLCVRMLAKAAEERPDMREVFEAIEGAADAAEQPRSRLRGQPRAQRMVSEAPPGPTQERMVVRPDGAELAVIGSLHGDMALALGANALVPFIVSDDQPVEDARAIYAPGLGVEELLRVREAHEGVPLLTTANPKDMDRVAALVKIGVDEVVHEPVTAAEVAKKAWRAIRRARRRRA